jgi:phospholipid transport system transporter-binding protein
LTFEWNASRSESSDTLQLIGNLTRTTLLPLWQQRMSLFKKTLSDHKSCLYIELNRLETVDSAGFVLICEIVHHYSEHYAVKLIDVPHLVKDFAELYDLDEWIKPYIQN